MTSPIAGPPALSHRDHAILLAVAGGRASMTCGAEPELAVDGLSVCDPVVGHVLWNAGLIEPATAAPPGRTVPAVLTGAGIAALRGWGAAVAH